MRLIIFTLLLNLILPLNAQVNLVKDSSFEFYNHLPELGYTLDINKLLPYWYQPTDGTPDYFHLNASDNHFSIPYNNFWGGKKCIDNYQLPRSGNAYVGFGIRNRFDTCMGKRVQEYIQTKFSLPLKKNHTFSVTFYVNKNQCTNNFSVSNIGAFISKDSIRQYYIQGQTGYYPNITNFEQKCIPQIYNKNLVPYRDTINWVPISGLYKSKGGENWITIGRFNDMLKTEEVYDTVIEFQGFWKYAEAYYYIDDVSVYEIPSVIFPDTVCKGEQVDFTSTFIGPFKWYKNNLLLGTDSIYTFIAQQSGQYVLQSSNRSDTFNLTVLQNADFNLGNDTYLCLGNIVSLNIPIPNAGIQWQNGERDSVLIINKGGQYIAKVQKNNCSYSDTIHIESRLKPGLEFSTNEICTFDSAYVELKLLNDTLKYYWPESKDNKLYKKIINKGCLPLTIIGNNQCYLDTAICIEGFCKPTLWIPNAFVPAGVNNVFQCKGINIKDFSMTIYNRWGEKVFISNNIDQGWNGDFKNQVCQAGVYVYIVSYSGIGTDKSSKIEKGVFELIW